jgi:hypothetical protein
MKVKHWCNADEKDMSIEELVRYEVSSVYSERGQLEDQQAKIEKLTDMVAALYAALPPEKQRGLASDFYYWKPT